MTPRAAAAVAALAAAFLLAREISRRVRALLLVGAGYKAKILCSALFVSGLDLDCERADEVSAEAYRPLRLFRARVDRGRGVVEVSFSGLAARRAVFLPGRGATLLPAAGRLPPPAPLPPPMPRRAAAPATPPPALLRVLTQAFEEPEPRRLRRTRALVVRRGGAVVAEAYAPGISPDTPLCGWSMTKSAFAAMLGFAVAKGLPTLDARKLLPEWSGENDARAGISFEDLLRMRSGLRFGEKYSDLSSDVNRMLFIEPDAGAFAASRPLESSPGELWRYSSGGSNIVSRVARLALGEAAYEELPRRALFEPLGMDGAVLERDAAGGFVASSYMFASARDWAKLGQLMLDDGLRRGRRILPEGWVRFLTSPTPQSPEGRYGAHWWLKLSRELGGQCAAAARLPADAFHALGHEGQCLTVIPSRGLVAVRMGVSIDVSAWNHAQFLADLLAALDA